MNKITKNIGPADQAVRLVLIVALVGGTIWAISSSVWLAVGLGTAAAILLGTVLTSTCPIWLIAGVNTRKRPLRT